MKKSNVNVFGNYDFRKMNFLMTGSFERNNFIDPNAAFLDQKSSGRNSNTNHFVKSGIDWSIDDLNSLSLSANYMNERRNQKQHY